MAAHPDDDVSDGLAGLTADVDFLDFGLFTAKPTLKALVRQSFPVVWATLIAIWPQLLSEFLSLVWCKPIQDDYCVRQRLVPNPSVECLSNDHLPAVFISVFGLSIWCLGIPGWLFVLIYRLGQERQGLENRRKYGLFIRGLEPWMWWWDLLVKRADIALMMLVAYTSMVEDETAKLFVFAFISGIMLCVTTWCKPYSKNQGQILDILETSLLTTRFVLYFTLAFLLIILPSSATVSISAFSLLAMLILVSMFAVLHIIAQLLRTEKQNLTNEDDEEEQDEQDRLKLMWLAKVCTCLHLFGHIDWYRFPMISRWSFFFLLQNFVFAMGSPARNSSGAIRYRDSFQVGF